MKPAAAISISPNPVKDRLYIKGLAATAAYSLQVVNSQGNILVKATVKQLASYNFNVKRLQPCILFKGNR